MKARLVGVRVKWLLSPSTPRFIHEERKVQAELTHHCCRGRFLVFL